MTSSTAVGDLSPDSNGARALTVAIVAYRSREHLRACLESLRESAPRRPFEVRVVDNGSNDGTVEMVERSFPEVALTDAGENLGFGRATNLAIGASSSEYVLALNPDTRVQPGTLDRLLELMDARPDVGICGCRLVREDGTLDHAAKRSFPTPLGALAHFTGVGRSERAPRRLAQYRAPDVERGEVDAVNGAFMLLRRRALEEVGLFDEKYWMYMEDLDLCYRFAAAGWKTWYEPSVSVLHVKWGSSGSSRSARLNVAFHYGMLRFYRKHYAGSRATPLNLLVYAGIGAKLGVSVVGSAIRRAVKHGPRP